MLFRQNNPICTTTDLIWLACISIKWSYSDHVDQMQIFCIAQNLFFNVKLIIRFRQVTDHIQVPFIRVRQGERKVNHWFTHQQIYFQIQSILILFDWRTIFRNSFVIETIITKTRFIICSSFLKHKLWGTCLMHWSRVKFFIMSLMCSLTG